jgi:N-glycosidase YbiA
MSRRAIFFFSRNSEFSAFSNFAPYGFEQEGIFWPTVEHYFQAQKFPGAHMAPYRDRIRGAPSPQAAKVLGRSEKFPLRSDWDRVKENIMRHALRRKFENPELRTLLLSTGKRLLVEDSPYDSYWGRGKSGNGRNRLGVLLMELREELRKCTSHLTV